MKKYELEQWYALLKQIKNGYHMSDYDLKELVRLNHLVMEEAHKVHNDNMLNILSK